MARFRLGEGLAETSPYLLLLSATPHQGKTDAFHRIMWLLDSTAFPDPTTVSRDHVQPYVIRTEKRRAITADGEPLFRPRHTQLVPIAWEAAHAQQRALYDAVTEYAREGYNQALQEKRTYIGFLMLLMQRLVTSSTRAIRTTLARRLVVLQAPEGQLELFPDLSEEEWLEMDGQEQTEALIQSRLKGLRSERAEVESLLRLAESCERTQSDAKAEALLDWIYRLQQEESDPALKVLVFTEFLPTQEMLRDFLAARGFPVVCLNGSMDMEERQKAQETFAGEARILISTDAGGEGLNLQFCHVVVNFDIPWNPMRLEQRIGRVDRIGQVHVVRAINFLLQDTVEYRVREVLEEFGMDKTGDVLDSAEAGALFDELYAAAITHPDQIATEVDALIQQVRERAQAVREGASSLPQEPPLDPRQSQELIAHPLPAWVERMTTTYLRARGGQVLQDGPLYDLTWPDGTVWHRVAFRRRDAELPGVRLVTLECRIGRGERTACRLGLLVSALDWTLVGRPLPLSGSPAGDHPAAARGAIRPARSGTSVLVLLPESCGVLPVRAALPERMDAGGPPDRTAGAVEGGKSMRRHIGLLIAGLSIAAAGCVSLPVGPSVMVLPAPGKPFEVFQAEDAICRQWAAQQAGPPGEAVTQKTAVGSAAGAAAGAALGAAIGSASGHAGTGAAIGAGPGLLTGTAVGANLDQVASWTAQRRYDMAYQQCMYAKGNQLPGVYPSAYRATIPPPPPPPRAYPSAPPLTAPPPVGP